ncbi:hypothetical protein AK830_g10467 [Neonectria ditissima]|uniref:TRP C-terminal domain-containing protein n=1 Tax=Neonectria ditissima TaxID=78410 RepID=A0A0N8H5G4_9HYPO|nr:hypothetical protein AK830_g10467 [Neonectria ditissima]
MRLSSLIVTAAALLLGPAQAVPTHQFDEFFPGWNDYLQDIIHNDCKRDYDFYRSGRINASASASSRVTPLINCILVQFPEFRKTEIAASAVILGLLPMILQSLGSTTAETALVGRRHPLLALLLAAGSPAVNVARGSEIAETLAKFVEVADTPDAIPGVQLALLSAHLRPVISILEYLLVGGAVANVVHLTYRLGVNAVVGFAPETIFMLPLWAFLAVVIHVGGLVVLGIRVRAQGAEGAKHGGKQRQQRASGFPAWVLDEFVPCAFQPAKFLQYRRETIWFPVLSWFLNLGVLAHIVLGTLVLSSLLFFSVKDAVVIVARFAGSAIVCISTYRPDSPSMPYKGWRQPLTPADVDRWNPAPVISYTPTTIITAITTTTITTTVCALHHPSSPSIVPTSPSRGKQASRHLQQAKPNQTMDHPSTSSDAASTLSGSTACSYAKDAPLEAKASRRGMRQRVRDVVHDLGRPPTAKQDAKDGKTTKNHIDVGPAGTVLMGSSGV